MKKRMAVCVALCALSAALCGAEPRFRNILDTGYTFVSGGSPGEFRAEDVFLYYASPAFIPSARVLFARSGGINRAGGQLGAVVVFFPGLYGEMAYGLFADGAGTLAQEGFVNLAHETDRTIAEMRLKAGYDQGDGVLSLIPDASFRFQFTPLYGAKAKYFFGWASDDFYSNTLQLENEFSLNRYWSLALILTGIRENLAGVDENRWSAGLRVKGPVAGAWTVKYLIQYHALHDGLWGLENGIAVDRKF